MIQWLIQSTADLPDLDRGVAPAALLNSAEESHLNRLTVAKRRRDWLLGRWTAKRLVQSYISQQTGFQPPLSAVTVHNAPDGAPTVSLSPGWSRSAIGGGPYREVWLRPALSLSISHCDNHALCALYVSKVERNGSHRRKVQIGADIEQIAPRSRGFVEDYFTPEEIEQVDRAPEQMRDLVVTLIWSAKEAVLKALRLGLTVDTRQVVCEAGPLLAQPENQDWSPLRLRYRATAHADDLILSGWWRTIDRYVLTIAAHHTLQGG